MKQKYNIIILVTLLITTSCSSYKNIPYFQDLDIAKKRTEPIENQPAFLIQPQDILGINITSINPESSAIFNTNLNRTNGNNFDINPSNPVVGYLVDRDGNIQMPIIGKVKAAGHTTTEIQELIQQKLTDNVKEPTVTIRLMNFKISVLGDVQRPGVYPVSNERITITEALALAGDLTITAKRKKVVLIREINGQREYTAIDLTSKNIFTSEDFYLKNNDLIYVDPSRTKLSQVDGSYRTLSLILSGLSIVAIVLSNLN